MKNRPRDLPDWRWAGLVVTRKRLQRRGGRRRHVIAFDGALRRRGRRRLCLHPQGANGGPAVCGRICKSEEIFLPESLQYRVSHVLRRSYGEDRVARTIPAYAGMTPPLRRQGLFVRVCRAGEDTLQQVWAWRPTERRQSHHL